MNVMFARLYFRTRKRFPLRNRYSTSIAEKHSVTEYMCILYAAVVIYTGALLIFMNCKGYGKY